jgi:hypothetical protein
VSFALRNTGNLATELRSVTSQKTVPVLRMEQIFRNYEIIY